jgi:hypothetical protein
MGKAFKCVLKLFECVDIGIDDKTTLALATAIL